MEIESIRKEHNLSQKEAALIACVPLRTYIRYESNKEYGDPLKRKQIIANLNEKFFVDEKHGILSIEKISSAVNNVICEKYKGKVEFCYLFGSYSKNKARENSDVDLCISTSLDGFGFVGLVKSFEDALHKKVDLVNVKTMGDNPELLCEIFKYGVKIYG